MPVNWSNCPNIPPPPPLLFPFSSTKRLLRYRNLQYFLLILLLALAKAASAQPAPQSAPLVYRLEIRDTIQPISAARLDRALAQASRDHAAALLVELDTPGGLLDSTRHMVGAILTSPVPVIVSIAPAGARAGSAGFFILEAADIAAMAPGTNAGAAHPVLASGSVPDETMKMKMENDAAAFLRSYSSSRGRNATLAEEAVRNSKSFSADEALAQHLIDLTAASESQLLAAIDGKTITRTDKSTLTMRLANAQLVTIEPTVRERLLSLLADPNLALLLLVAGALLVYLEFNTPGTIVPGALGTVLVLLGVFSLNLLPIRHTAILLLIAAAVLIILEVKFTSHGALALAGITCLVFGTLTLVDAPIPEMAVHPWLAVSLALAFGGISVVLLRLAIRAKRNKSLIGPAALVGSAAVAMEDISALPTGHVLGHILVQGEIWQATSPVPLPAQAKVKVTGHQGDTLQVELLPANHSELKYNPS